MALYKRGDTWWITITREGSRIQKSTGTSNKLEAQQFYDKTKAELWKVSALKLKPTKDWNDAVLRWCEESKHKRSLKCDISNLRWLDKFLNGMLLKDITRDRIEQIALIKENSGVTPATVNRVLAIIRSILRKAEREWEWIDRAPTIRMRKENNKRIRWITFEEAKRLKNELPQHLSDAMEFALHTGLRESNISSLEWSQINFDQCHCFIPASKSKSGLAIAVPLNNEVMNVLQRQIGKHCRFVFTYKGQPIRWFNTKAWRKALSRASITDFKWQDLRHTWASWHVQHGTSLQELQQLGGWASYEMVLRYAHLSSSHLRAAAERISATNLLQSVKVGDGKVRLTA
jgi:integrase